MSRGGSSSGAGPAAPELDARERAELAEAVELARASGQTRWVARVVEVEALDALAAYAAAGLQDRFFWEQADLGESFCSWGVVDETESAGRRRFDDVRIWSESVRSRIHWLGAPRSGAAPLFVGGFGFDEASSASEDWKAFPAARFVLPAVLGERGRDGARWVVLARLEPGVSARAIEGELADRLEQARSTQAFDRSDTLEGRRVPHGAAGAGRDLRTDALLGASHPDRGFGRLPVEASGPEVRVRSDRAHGVYVAQVEDALTEIGTGRLQKVVLARALRVQTEETLDVAGFLERLRELYGSCVLVAMGRGEDTFLAATPETLVRLQGRRLTTAALAGSAPRGRTPDEDRALGEGLCSSAKDRAEHAHVVDALRVGLAPFCTTLEIPSEPRLREDACPDGDRQFSSPASSAGEADRAPDILDLVRALHPTPAVGGVPGPAALDWLRRFEALERGWYAGPLGWLDAQGGGDFRVALRSTLIRNRPDGCRADGSREQPDEVGCRAWLYAGAGIVAGSQPAQELAETRMKLRALLAPLTEI
jgi:isochorismate synthase EntC